MSTEISQAKLTIDLAAIQANWRALSALSRNETAAVVKANAYGLGLSQVAPVLAEAGARRFFVAQVSEGVALRKVLGAGPEIFVFEGYPKGAHKAVVEADLWPLLNSGAQIARFRSECAGRPVGLQLDTGMNRLGLEMSDLVGADLSNLNLQLVMSHLACADTPDHPQNAAQRATFDEMSAGFACPRSLAATGGTLMGPLYHYDVTRPGIGLFGGLPFADARPVVTLSLPVIQTRRVEAGEAVGYGADWRAPSPRRIATLSAGYADGLIRALGGGVPLWAGDTPCPLVGRVSMDLITVDVTDLDHEPESLEILGPHQGIDAIAMAAGTIGYEILTSLGTRYHRVYKSAG